MCSVTVRYMLYKLLSNFHVFRRWTASTYRSATIFSACSLGSLGRSWCAIVPHRPPDLWPTSVTSSTIPTGICIRNTYKSIQLWLSPDRSGPFTLPDLKWFDALWRSFNACVFYVYLSLFIFWNFRKILSLVNFSWTTLPHPIISCFAIYLAIKC